MKSYSPYIKKYLKPIESAGYSISKDGSQLYKKIGDYEILITDLTVKSLLMIKTVLVWIKNSETKMIEKERLFRQEILPLPFSKIDNFAKTIVEDLNSLHKEKEIREIRIIVKNLDPDMEKVL